MIADAGDLMMETGENGCLYVKGGGWVRVKVDKPEELTVLMRRLP